MSNEKIDVLLLNNIARMQFIPYSSYILELILYLCLKYSGIFVVNENVEYMIVVKMGTPLNCILFIDSKLNCGQYLGMKYFINISPKLRILKDIFLQGRG